MSEAPNAGRPRLHVLAESLSLLIRLGLNSSRIHRLLGISRTTVWRLRRQYQLMEASQYSNISDADLDAIIANLLFHGINTGERLVQGHLLSQNIRIQRSRLRQRIGILDPVGREFRRQRTIRRRNYFVSNSNALWHIDSNHKLISWRFVIHGCIDGFSRKIIYLKCEDNNRAQTSFTIFQEAITQHGLPLRVRGDRGVENIDIARFMIEQRGLGRGSFIAGRSVHNQRKERLWRDVNRVVSDYYRRLFRYFERESVLDSNDDIHLYVLHFIFKSLINLDLNTFVNSWNNHSLSSANNMTPLQLWVTRLSASWQSFNIPIVQNYPVSNISTSNMIAVPLNYFTPSPEQIYALNEILESNRHTDLHYMETFRLMCNYLNA